MKEADLSMRRRLWRHEESNLLAVQTNLAVRMMCSDGLKALQMRQEAYSGRLKLNGEEHQESTS